MKVIYRREIPGILTMIDRILELFSGEYSNQSLPFLLLVASRKLAPESCGVHVEVLEKKTRNFLTSKLPEGVSLFSLDKSKYLSFLNYCKKELTSAFPSDSNDSLDGQTTEHL